MTSLPFTPAATPTAASPSRLALDNLIRRELKVGDPGDSRQIADALLERYKNDPRARAINQESSGLPFLQAAATAPLAQPVTTSTDSEWRQAIDDIDQDLRHLTADSLVKDAIPELQGWSQAIRSALLEGIGAARFALDPRQRDKAFGIRRQFNDYARIARLVGALSAGVNPYYRKLAQSLDEAASVLLVAMGESLANVGFGGGRYLLQAPYGELQVRRDAVINALRNMVGATQTAFAPNEWPRGLDAYRNLFRQLEAQGQGDLRALLQETELARIMDELIQRAAHGNIDGLRALGSTAQIDLTRFRRLVAVAQNLLKPESPPLTAFLEALLLFAEAFDPAGGFRLLRIARPPILLYGLYGMQRMSRADQRLLQLVQTRGVFAGLLDCRTACDCSEPAALCQIVLDKVLYDLDRAIDLYAQGNADLGEQECRASSFSFVVDAALLQCCDFGPSQVEACNILLTRSDEGQTSCTLGAGEPVRVLDSILDTLLDIRGLLRPLPASERGSQPRYWDTAPATYALTCLPALRHQELCVQRSLEKGWRSLVASLAPGCVADAAVFAENGGIMPRLMRRAINLSTYNLFVKLNQSGKPVSVEPETVIAGLLSKSKKLDPTSNLTLCDLIDGEPGCNPFDLALPPHYETSLNSIAEDIDAQGIGR